MRTPEFGTPPGTDSESFRARLFDARLVLLLGLGGLLTLVAVTAIFVVSRMSALEREHEAVREELSERSEILARIRTHLLTTSTLVRDYLLNNDREDARLLREDLAFRWSEITALRARYEERIPSSEKPEWTSLGSALDSYWAHLGPIWSWNHAERLRIGRKFVQDEIVPRRGRLLDLATRISRTEKEQLAGADARMARSISALKNATLWTSAVLILLGLAVAVVSTAQLVRKQRSASEYYADAVRGRERLDELSIGLLTGQDRERHRLADELHDSVGQTLSGLLLWLDNLKVEIESNSQKHAAEDVVAIRKHAAEVVTVVRRVCLLLWPSMLQEIGLSAAIESRARHISQEFGTRVLCSVEEDERLNPEQQVCVYRAVEAVLEHMAAEGVGSIDVSLRWTEANAIVAITADRSIGGDCFNHAIGLLAAQQRLSHSGGQFRVLDRGPANSCVEITIPCRGTVEHAESTPAFAVGPGSGS